MKQVLMVLAASVLVAGCISTDMGTQGTPKPGSDVTGVNHERGTGSNISRRDRDVREGGREELERLQRPGGSNQIGKSAGS